jgi:hypothetical protein
MAKLIIKYGLSLFPVLLFSQQYTWNLTMSNYEPLEDAIQLTDDTAWGTDVIKVIFLDYEIPYFDEFITSMNVYVGGAEIQFPPNASRQMRIVGDWYADTELLADRGEDMSESQVLYKIEGDPGERILKIEYRNMGFYFDETNEDYINFQVWFYENGCIEVRWGGHNVNANVYTNWFAGPAFAIFSPGWDKEDIILTGFGDNPNVMFVINEWGHIYHLDSTPSANMVYQFCLNDVSNTEETTENVEKRLFPNPTTGRFISQISIYKIYNL